MLEIMYQNKQILMNKFDNNHKQFLEIYKAFKDDNLEIA